MKKYIIGSTMNTNTGSDKVVLPEAIPTAV
jgi:hypothetical protein